MRRSARFTIGLVLTGLVGCGQGTESPGLAISFSNRALFADAEILAIYFYKDGAGDGATLRATRPRLPSVLGPFLVELGQGAGQTSALFRVPNIPPDTYVVFVDAQTYAGGNVGAGCTPGQVVVADELSTIQVVISE